MTSMSVGPYGLRTAANRLNRATLTRFRGDSVDETPVGKTTSTPQEGVTEESQDRVESASTLSPVEQAKKQAQSQFSQNPYGLCDLYTDLYIKEATQAPMSPEEKVLVKYAKSPERTEAYLASWYVAFSEYQRSKGNKAWMPYANRVRAFYPKSYEAVMDDLDKQRYPKAAIIRDVKRLARYAGQMKAAIVRLTMEDSDKFWFKLDSFHPNMNLAMIGAEKYAPEKINYD